MRFLIGGIFDRLGTLDFKAYLGSVDSPWPAEYDGMRAQRIGRELVELWTFENHACFFKSGVFNGGFLIVGFKWGVFSIESSKLGT